MASLGFKKLNKSYQGLLANKTDWKPLKCSKSYEVLPPYLSELRVVLLGNSWSQRSSVGNLLLDQTVFNTETEPSHFVILNKEMHGKNLIIINSPDLLQPDLSADRLTELIEEMAEASAPGPHVFLLVLQPEDFTEQHKTRLQSVLEEFSEQAFDHSLVLISTPREETPGFMEDYRNYPLLKDVIIKCRYRYLNQKSLTLSELETKLDQVINQYNGEHLRCEFFLEEDISSTRASSPEHQETPEVSLSSGGLRIVLIGRSGSGKSTTANTVLGKKFFKPRVAPKKANMSCEKVCGTVERRHVAVVNTPPLFDRSFKGQPLHQELSNCISLLSPGPHAFLLVLPIGNMSTEDRDSLEMIKKVFGKKAADFVMIVFTRGDELTMDYTVENYIEECDDLVKDLLIECQGRYHVLNNKDETNRTQVAELLEKIDKMVQENSGFTQEMYEIQKVKEQLEESERRAWAESEEKEDVEKQLVRLRLNIKRAEQEREEREKYWENQCQKLKKDRNFWIEISLCTILFLIVWIILKVQYF